MSIYGNPVTLGPRWMTVQKVSILPYQNLHGYDHPWPAGGGKNILPKGVTSEHNGIIYIVQDNGEVIITGTASSTSFWAVKFTIPAGTYIINGCPSGGGTSTYRIDVRYSSAGALVSSILPDTGTGTTFTISEPLTAYLHIRVNSGYSVPSAGLKFSPMIRLSSVTDPSFAPYSNICPVSGWEDCQIWVSPTPNPADGTTYQTLFGNPPGTVYGGTLDVTNGVLSVTHLRTHMGGFPWTYTSSEYFYTYIGGKAVGNYNIISDIYKTSSGPYVADMDDFTIKGSPTTRSIYVKDSRYTVGTDLANALNGHYMVFELDTPVTYQLTPQQISFLGNQYFGGASCGPVLIKVGK